MVQQSFLDATTTEYDANYYDNGLIIAKTISYFFPLVSYKSIQIGAIDENTIGIDMGPLRKFKTKSGVSFIDVEIYITLNSLASGGYKNEKTFSEDFLAVVNGKINDGSYETKFLEYATKYNVAMWANVAGFSPLEGLSAFVDEPISNNDDNDLSKGGIAGIVIGVVAFVAIVFCFVYFCFFANKGSNGSTSNVSNPATELPVTVESAEK